MLKITDFGLSKQWTEPMKSYVGTKMYMAPEVIEARNHPRNSFLSYTYKADMWSLGCILYSILCGCHAFVGEQDSTLEASKLILIAPNELKNEKLLLLSRYSQQEHCRAHGRWEMEKRF